MARAARLYLPGVPLHVIQRGNDRAALFHDALDFECYLGCLSRATRHYAVAVHAYVLMTNHVHLLVTPGSRESLGKAMHWSGTVYVQQINIRHGRTGSRFEGRYKVRAIEDETHLVACMRYIEQNPVRAGMVASPEQYRWSSYHANALGAVDGLVKTHPIFERMGTSPAERVAHYRGLFATALSGAEVSALKPTAGRRGRPANGDRPVMGYVPNLG